MASNLPHYVASAQPVPQEARVPWFKSTAQTYAGIMLWFVFWESVPTSAAEGPAGILAQGLGTALLAVIVGAIICHFASYLAPGLMGMKTGLPLAVVGTSTYGVVGGLLMPGFLMGLLQFGWLAVNAYFSSKLLAWLAGFAEGSAVHMAIGVAWAAVAAFVGLKGIHYVAKVATFLPLIPLVILLILLGKTASGIGDFQADALTKGVDAPGSYDLFLLGIANIVGFFATAGAAGADIASSNRNSTDVQLGGLFGVAGATIFTGCAALLIVAGTYGSGLVDRAQDTPTVAAAEAAGGGEAADTAGAAPAQAEQAAPILEPTRLMATIMGDKVAKVFWLLLAAAAFPPACFSSLIAANSMKNTLPKVNPFVSVGIGTAASIALVLSKQAGEAAQMFGIIGASFGPVCGSMTADYILSGFKWPGPRAGVNLAGWIAWIVGFYIGAIDMIVAKVPAISSLALHVPCPPVAAILVGFVLYLILAMIGLQSRTLEMPAAEKKIG